MPPKRQASKSPSGRKPPPKRGGAAEDFEVSSMDEEMKTKSSEEESPHGSTAAEMTTATASTGIAKSDEAKARSLEAKKAKISRIYEISRQVDLLLASASKSEAQEVVKMLAQRHGYNCVPTRSAPIVVGSQATAANTSGGARPKGKAPKKGKTLPPPKAEWKKDPDWVRLNSERDHAVSALKSTKDEAERSRLVSVVNGLNQSLAIAKDAARKKKSL